MLVNTDLGSARGDHRWSLSNSERNYFCEAFAAARETPADVESFLAVARALSAQLPANRCQQLSTFGVGGNDVGALLIQGLPTDLNLPPTPGGNTDEHAVGKSTYFSELALASVAVLLGEPVGYAQEHAGALFQNVWPTRTNEAVFSSESSAIFLPFHTEMAFHPFMPDFVCLYCLRPDATRSARTLVCSARQILPRLTSTQFHLLSRCAFETGIDYSFGRPSGTRGGGRVVAILKGPPENPVFTFDPDLMVAHVPNGDRLLLDVTSLIAETANWVTLDAGDLLILDNRHAVHARTRFPAFYDGSDRWLQRLCVVQSLLPSATDRTSPARVIRTTFNTPQVRT